MKKILEILWIDPHPISGSLKYYIEYFGLLANFQLTLLLLVILIL